MAENFLEGLETSEDIVDTGDVLGGGGVFPSDVYEMAIKMAYLDKSTAGAKSMNFVMETPEGKQYRTTEYITSGDAKGNRNYYEKNGKKYYLPGFNLVNQLAKLVASKELFQTKAEMKLIKVWDWDARAEVETKKVVFMDLVGKKIQAALLHQIVDKNQKNPATGNYEPTGDTREVNVFSKAFHPENGMTMTEIEGESKTAEFKQKWLKKWKDVIDDQSEGKKGLVTMEASLPDLPTASASAGQAEDDGESIFKEA